MEEVSWFRRYTRWRQTSRSERKEAERQLLSCAAAGSTPVRAFDTRVGSGERDVVHALECGVPTDPPLLLLPGYGAGAAFFWKNLSPLAAGGYRCFAVDWLGTGLSGRPAFTASTHGDSVRFFLDALESWRHHNGLEKVSILGHSLGAYLAALYALEHPERVERLILVGPAGLAARGAPPPDSLLYRALTSAWEGGITPGSVVRFLGPLAPGRALYYAQRRFRDGEGLRPVEEQAFGAYVHHILAARGSGEFALPHLLAPGAWARQPLLSRLKELQMPLTFIYGVNDWMDWRSGAEAVNIVREQAGQPAGLCRVANAGHYPMIDNPGAFHKQVLNAMLGRPVVSCGDQAPRNGAGSVKQDMGSAREVVDETLGGV